MRNLILTGPGLETESHDEMDSHEMNEESGPMTKMWNTLQFSLAWPIRDRMMFQSEAAIIMKGLEIAPEDWDSGPPVILTIGVSYSL